MSITECNHIRIRGSYDNSIDIEKFIRSLELQYKTDIRSVAKWKDLIKTLYNSKNELKTKIRNATARKKSIIEKLCVQNYRPSPFVLTDELARTAKVWDEIELYNRKKRVVDIKETTETIVSYKCKNYKEKEFGGEEEFSEGEQLTVHPNTEVVGSKQTIPFDTDDVKSESSLKLPVIICTNPHKFISPVGSHCTALSYHSINTLLRHQIEPTEIKELDQTKSVRCYPKEIKVYNEKEQPIKFFLTNCTNEYAFIRFKELINIGSLRKFTITPVIPIKLCAGLSKLYCLYFKMMPDTKIFEGIINFKIGKVSYETFEEMLSIPFSCNFTEKRSINVSETVSIRSVYPWQVSNKNNYPMANITICVNDDFFYHLHVTKHVVHWSKLLGDESINSLDVVSPNSESMIQRNDDAELESAFCTSSKFDDQQLPDEAAETMDYISKFLNEILNLSLEPFFIKNTYMYLHPQSVRKIPVYLRKPENIGHHHCYYDFEFYNPNDESIVISKTIKVLAEILPHPIEIHPIILDMTENSIKQGMCVNFFTIKNTHIFVPVTIKIKLTTKMRKLFKISPMETLIPAQSEVPFEVWCCPKSVIDPEGKCEESVHFTFKIIIIGDKAVYENVPPMFYEIIIPCAAEFKRVYGKKYFTDSPTLSQDPLPVVSQIENQAVAKVSRFL